MKRKLAMLALVLCLGVSMTACGEENTKTEETESTEDTAAEDYNLDEIVTLGEYKGIARLSRLSQMRLYRVRSTLSCQILWK